MLTDAPPRKANRAKFLESDQMKMLDLPKNGHLPPITKSIESAMKGGKGSDIGRVCTEFLGAASNFYRVPNCAIRVLATRPFASPRKLEHGAFRGLHSRNHANPGLDADGSAQGSHVVWNLPEHTVP